MSMCCTRATVYPRFLLIVHSCASTPLCWGQTQLAMQCSVPQNIMQFRGPPASFGATKVWVMPGADRHVQAWTICCPS